MSLVARSARQTSARSTAGGVPRPGRRGGARYTTEAIVIRQIPFAETSQVVHLATPEQGLVAALAKGARRPGAAFEGGLSLLERGEAELSRRAGAELELLLRFRHGRAFPGLGRDLGAYLAASYVVEILRAWLRPALPNPALYGAARTALGALGLAETVARAAWVCWFEARAVAAVGLRPRLDACAVCERAVGGGAAFSPAAGGLVHARCAPDGPRASLSPALRQALVRLYTARIDELAREPLASAEVRALRRLHDLLLPHLLERRPASLAALPR